MDALTTKLAALAGAIFMNTLVMSAVGYCFALQSNTYMTAVAFAKVVVTQQALSWSWGLAASQKFWCGNAGRLCQVICSQEPDGRRGGSPRHVRWTSRSHARNYIE
jgi:hypothetical protein